MNAICQPSLAGATLLGCHVIVRGRMDPTNCSEGIHTCKGGREGRVEPSSLEHDSVEVLLSRFLRIPSPLLCVRTCKTSLLGAFLGGAAGRTEGRTPLGLGKRQEVTRARETLPQLFTVYLP